MSHQVLFVNIASPIIHQHGILCSLSTACHLSCVNNGLFIVHQPRIVYVNAGDLINMRGSFSFVHLFGVDTRNITLPS
jgi:hypothetical protein